MLVDQPMLHILWMLHAGRHGASQPPAAHDTRRWPPKPLENPGKLKKKAVRGEWWHSSRNFEPPCPPLVAIGPLLNAHLY